MPAMEGNTSSCFCNVKYLCRQLGCRAVPHPGGLSTPASCSCSYLGIYAIVYSSFLSFPPPSCEMQSQKSVCASALGSAPRPVWLEDATYVLGLEPGPLRLPNVPMSLPRGCGGVRSPGAPASCPGSSVEHEERSCRLFITVLKLSQIAKRPGDTATAARWSLQRTLLFAWPRCFAGGRALAATAQAVSSGAFSLYIGCTSHRIPSGAAGAGRSGTAV